MTSALLAYFLQSSHRRDHQQIVLYSFCRSMRLLFICKDFNVANLHMKIEHWPTYICQLYFPPECQQDRTLLRNQYY